MRFTLAEGEAGLHEGAKPPYKYRIKEFHEKSASLDYAIADVKEIGTSEGCGIRETPSVDSIETKISELLASHGV